MDGAKKPGENQGKFEGWRRIAAGMLLISGVAVLDQNVLAQRGSFAATEPTTNSSTATASTVDAGKMLMRQAREAFNRNDYSRAKLLAERAKEIRKPGQIWEDTPERLFAEIEAKTKGKSSASMAPTARKVADPRVLLKMGRDALNSGKIDEAQDLARQAEANQSATSWRLFEDTPASLIRDVAKAKSKRDKEESSKLLVEARKLFDKKTTGEGERQANLEKAQALATQAERLHGPYSFWEFGEKPAKLLSEIETAQARNRNSNVLVKSNTTKSETTVAKNTKTSPIQTVSNSAPKTAESPVKTAVAMQKATPTKTEMVQSDLRIPGLTNPAPSSSKKGEELVIPSLPELGGTNTKTPAVATATVVDTASKQKAVAFMAAGRSLAAKGDYAGAKEKFVQAISLNAPFDAKEESPELALQKLQSVGIKKMADLCNEASNHLVKQEVEQAEAKLNAADSLAKTLGLDAQPVQEHRKALVAMKSPGATVEPIKTVGANPATMPNLMPAGNSDPSARQANEMLASARLELRKGETDTARRIVEEVMVRNLGNKAEAEALLRTIDAEEFNQRSRTALRSFENGVAAYNANDHRQALAIFQLIDPAILPAQKQSQLKDLLVASAAALKQDVPAIAKMEPMGPIQQVANNEVKPVEIGSAKVNAAPSDADNLIKQQQALQEIQFQKLRSEGLKVQTEATAKFGKGDTDSAIRELQNYMNRVKESSVEANKQALLVRPIENRLEQFRVMKKQQDFLTAEDKSKQDYRQELTQSALADQHKKQEVAKLMKQYHDLFEGKKYAEAGMLAQKMRELDPDDPSTMAAVQLARTAERSVRWNTIKEAKEIYNFETGNEPHEFGPPTTMKNPLVVDPEMVRVGRNRADLSKGIGELRNRTEREREIEMKLTKPVSLNFKDTPLREVVTYFSTVQGLNISLDTEAMEAQNLNPNMPITEKLNDIQLRSALNIILKKVHLTHIIEDDVLKITTEKGARGKLVTRTFPIADLVVPVENAVPSPVNDLTATLERQLGSRANIGGVSPFNPAMGLNQGQGTPVGTSSGLRGQKLETAGQAQITKSMTNENLEAKLIKLIKSTIKPDSWSDLDGPGTVDFYPLGFALVVNQTPDVIEQVESLLEALRRLQDLEVAVEIRLVSLSESFYERIGIDFSMNIKTDTTSFEPNLTQGANRPTPFVNDINTRGVTAGWSPTGFTNDLDIPIRSSSFSFTNPAFGGFPNALGANGGISLGLAFLNDIQVYMFMEAAQGDRRVNVMQAPRLTAFNGQSATINIQDQQFFVTNMTALSVNGQVIFIPENQPIPLGVSMTIQPVVDASRRFVRMNINQTMNNLTSATVPLYPITTFITPVLEGGFIGQPIPFTNFLQQPSLSSLTINTTVIVPDGGTVLIGGMKTLSEGRNEFGPPVLSKIPYVNRLFKNVGYGREAQSLMMMITPRIIINAEEQERQTGQTDDMTDQ